MTFTDLQPTYSTGQEFTLKVYSVYGLLSVFSEVSVNKFNNVQGISGGDIFFSIEAFETTRGRLMSLNDSSYDFIEIETVSYAENMTLSDYVSPVCLVNYKESTRYTIFNTDSKTIFSLDRVLFYSKKVKISPTGYTIATIFRFSKKKLIDTVFPHILHKAVKAKKVFLSQLFYVGVPYVRKVYLEPSYTHINPYIKKQQTSHNFIDVISLPSIEMSSTAWLSKCVVTDGESLFIREPVGCTSCDLDSVTFPLVSFDYELSGDSLYEFAEFKVGGENLSDALYYFAFKTDPISLDDYISEEVVVVPIVYGNPYYTIVELRDYYGPEGIYDFGYINGGEHSSLLDSVYELATFIDHKDIGPVYSINISMYVSEAKYSELKGMTVPLLELHGDFEGIKPISLKTLYSPNAIFDYRQYPYKRTDGLYRDIFVDKPDFVVHPATPWINNETGLRKIGDTKYEGYISFDSGIRVVQVEPTKYTVILMDWEPAFIMPTPYSLDRKHYPMLWLKDLLTGDFMIVALGTYDASFVHVHFGDYMDGYSEKYRFNVEGEDLIEAAKYSGVHAIIDSRKLERAINYTTSNRYLKAAKIMYDVRNGLIYSDSVIKDAMRYLRSMEEYLSAFYYIDGNGNRIYANANPLILRRIIDNKTAALDGRDVFSPPTLYTATAFGETVEFYYQELSDIPYGGVREDYVTDISFCKIAPSIYPMSNVIHGVSVSDSKYTKVLTLCNMHNMCGAKHLTGNRYDGILSITTMSISHPLEIPERSPVVCHDCTGVYRPVEPYTFDYIEEYISIAGFEVEIQNYDLNSVYLDGTITVSTGAYLSDVYANGMMYIGLKNLEDSTYNLAPIVVAMPDKILSDTYSSFNIHLHLNLKRDMVGGYYSVMLPAGVDIGFMNMADIKTEYEVIWMKMFFPAIYDKADITEPIYSVHITEQDFSVQMVMPYSYVDEHITTEAMPAKSSTPMLKEKKAGKDGAGGGDRVVKKPEDKVCGPERTMTYLDYVGFDYMFADNLNRLYGMYPKSAKEILFSGVAQVATNTSFSKGRLLSESDLLKRSIVDSTIYYIDNLGDAVDWKIEEFSLDISDFEGMALSAEDYDAIDSVFRDSMKFVLNTMGEEGLQREVTEEVNMFPQYPDRPIPDNSLSTTVKVHQFFIVEEENV